MSDFTVMVLADSTKHYGIRVIYETGAREYVYFDVLDHDFLKRFPSDPPRSRMRFQCAGELREHLRLHGDWLREMQGTIWQALIDLLHHERKRRPARTAAARRKDAREKRD